jgi:hypothetical protein
MPLALSSAYRESKIFYAYSLLKRNCDIVKSRLFTKKVIMSIQILDQPLEEKVVTLLGVSWEQFKAIEIPLLDNREVKLTYLAGVLEIMAPIGDKH